MDAVLRPNKSSIRELEHRSGTDVQRLSALAALLPRVRVKTGEHHSFSRAFTVLLAGPAPSQRTLLVGGVHLRRGSELRFVRARACITSSTSEGRSSPATKPRWRG
eukprot:scaffold368_cov258-Pinguiococcus_pyrenoidosus.AAC.74